MIKQYKTILIDMYGVILKESKGKLLKYCLDKFGEDEFKRIETLIHTERLFDKVGLGEISLGEFLNRLGFKDHDLHMKNYLENYLTLDNGFIDFAERAKGKYELVLLSNDVAEWSSYITELHGINKYFKHKTVSAAVNCRKPDFKIYELTLEAINRSPYECIFIDNSVANLNSAEELGIAPILFNRDNEHYYGAEVYSFAELCDLLGV